MLYKFQCKKSADVLMLDDLTQVIFGIINKPLEPRGIFLVEQLPLAIKNLEEAIEADLELKKQTSNADSDTSGDKDEQPTPIKQYRLGQRAFPFLKLLKEAQINKEPITWGV
jgi:hypothetical protein